MNKDLTHGKIRVFYSFVAISMYNNHFSNQNKFSNPGIIIPTIMFSSSSYRVLFQSFCPQNITLLSKIVTETHANLKKKKTSCNTTILDHSFLYAVMVMYTPLERSSLSSLIC